MALLASGMALAMIAVRVMALLALVMVSLAPGLALGLVLLPLLAPPLALLALVPAGTRAQRLEQLKTRRTRQREPHEASGLVRGRLPRLQGAVAAVEA